MLEKYQRDLIKILRVIIYDGSALLILAMTVFFFLALGTYDAMDPCTDVVSHQDIQNSMGAIGAEVSSFAFQVFGLSAWIFPVVCLACFYQLSQGKNMHKVFGFGLLACLITTLILPVHWASYPNALGVIAHAWIPQYVWMSGFILTALVVGIRWWSPWRYFVIQRLAPKSSPRSSPQSRPQSASRPLAPQPPQPSPSYAQENFSDVIREPLPKAHRPLKISSALPSLTLLKDPVTAKGDRRGEIHIARLQEVLEDFGIKGTVLRASPGPIVTLYELEPAAGVKSSRIISLADDIARSMSALSARVAVISGKNLIGIELSNTHREMVYLKDLLGSTAYSEFSGHLALTLGKDISGNPVIADLTKMPHVLVAGTTGSGKSVGINSMILSLLYRLSPEQCKLVMIDPKMLELSVYDGIPHLLTPVITEPKKAIMALKWVVQEMENRYRLMSQVGVRNIMGYNQRLTTAENSKEPIVRKVQVGFDEQARPVVENQRLDVAPMPFIVVIVDEMADLMLVAGKDLEILVQRLAQMARAAGIHIIMATQRPSVDVITGTIKANFPTRISFQVTSKIDSRTILGEQGAEQLLGQGDMLSMAAGGRITRVHGPFVSDGEIDGVVNFLKQLGEPNYVDITIRDDPSEGSSLEEGGDDLYRQAVEIVRQDRKTSISYLQRQLQIGYNRAAGLIEQMEKDGIISAANHLGKRKILN
jgi:S-DNA-T family DNA segregation ATPase FtsK/SpoIIIE